MARRPLGREKQGVALTGRNRTGPPYVVGHPIVHAPDGWPARPPAALQTTTIIRFLSFFLSVVVAAVFPISATMYIGE